MNKPDISIETMTLPLILLIAAAVRIYGLGWGLPDLFEEATPMLRAWNMWGWGSSRGIDLNPHFFNYPGLTIYLQFIIQGLLYAGMRLFGVVGSTAEYQALYVVDKTPFVYAARSVSVLAGTASVWVLYRIGSMISGRKTAVIAALLLALDPFHISKSQSIEVDITLTFLLLLAVWAILRLFSSRGNGAYILAGCLIGLAASAKYTAALLVLPLLAAHLFVRHERPVKKGKDGSQADRPSLIPLLLALGAAAAVFIITSPYTIFDHATFRDHLALEREHMSIGHFGLDSSNTPAFYLASLAGRILGWPLTLIGAAGLLYFLIYRRERRALVLCCFMIPYLAAIMSWSMRADRYLLPVFPLLILFASMSLSEIYESGRFSGIPRPVRIALCVISIILIAFPLLAFFPGQFRRLRPDTRTIAREWIEENLPSGCFIATEPYGPELIYPQVLASLNDNVRGIVMRKISGRNNYAVQPIPMFQTYPERSAPYYDIKLYRDTDIIITSGTVKSRYTKEPQKFARHLEFYGSLERDFPLVRRFTPSDGPGPELAIYRNPAHTSIFGGRRRHAGPSPLDLQGSRLSSSEELFYLNLGMNYETFRFYREALESYRQAFRYPVIRPSSYDSLVLGIMRCLMAMKLPGEAAAHLDSSARDAPTPRLREKFERMSGQIRSRTPTD